MAVIDKLNDEALHAFKWQYTGTVLQVLLQFVIGATLARLLSPEAFGLVGMALIPIGFGSLLGDLGFGTAIIQRPSLQQEHLRSSFTCTLTVGILLFLLLWIFTPAISLLFSNKTVIPVLRTTGILFILSGMSATPIALLRRELRFRTLAGIQTASYILGFGGVGILMALLDCGVWSLTAAYIVQALLLVIMAIYSTKQPLWPYFGVQEYRDLLRVGSVEILNNVTNYVAENLDSLVTGSRLGATALGLYNRSFYMMDLPVRHLSSAVFNVMFPYYSKIQGDIPRVGRAFLRTVSLTSMVTIPLFLTMAIAPEVIIGGLLGEKWKMAAGSLRILCLSGPFIAMLKIFGALSHGQGYIFNEWAREPIYLIAVGVGIWFLLPYGVEGVASAVALGAILRYLMLAHLSLKIAHLSWQRFFFAQLPGCLLGASVGMSIYFVTAINIFSNMRDILQFFLIFAVSLLSLTISLLLFPAQWFGDLYLWLNGSISTGSPYWLRKLIAAKASAVRLGSVI